MKCILRMLCMLFAVSGVFIMLAPNTLAASYQATDIVTFDTGTWVTISGINSSGMLAGTAMLPDGKQLAFTWSTATGVHYLNPMQGYETSVALGISDNGQVIGYSSYSGYRFRASLWEASNPVQDLGALSSGEFTPSSRAAGINNDGQIVGASTCSLGTEHAVLWTGGAGYEDINETDGFINASASAVNDNGVVVGEREGHAFVWSRTTGIYDIPVTGLGSTTAVDINNAGQVIGQYYSGAGIGPAFVWQEGHTPDILGVLSGSGPNAYTSVSDINNLGQVVGKSNDQAFIWERLSGIQPLPLPVGHQRGAAGGINDSGLIAGYSFDGAGRAHLVLWTPVPEPSSILTLLCSIGGFAWHRKRQA